MIYVLMILSFVLQLAIARPDGEARIPTSTRPNLESMISSARDGPGSTAPSPRDDQGLASTPSRWDMWVAVGLAGLLARSPGVDLFVDQGVARGVLGGVWYAAALFLFWVRGAQPGQQNVRRRMLTLALGSFVAALLTLFEAQVVSWPPPSMHPELTKVYPENFPVNLNANSFPSQSTALYAAVASGLYSLSKTLGVWAWIGVGMLVALPRMYLGGHYLTDILGGLAAGLGGYWLAVLLLGRTVVPWCEAALEHGWDNWRRTVAEGAVFLWILQVAVEFDHVVWMTHVLVSLWR